MSEGEPTVDAPIRVFVHLARGFGASEWLSKFESGRIIGLNDRLPYGYFRAAEVGCAITYSEDGGEGLVGRCWRLSLRVLLGFDFVHAWRNRHAIREADAVWTHTESQHLGVLLLLALRPRTQRRPKLIAQTVWLFDRWHRLFPLHRRLYSRLMAGADVLTVLSPENLKVARGLFPNTRSEMVPFGIPAERMVTGRRRPSHRPIRVLSLGNDRHRDWATLVAAVRGWDGCALRLVSGAVPQRLVRDAPNVAVMRPKTNDELMCLYEWADIVALAIGPNLHASGITVVEEAIVCGLPVICTDIGGLRAYFADDAVCFVPAGRPEAVRAAIERLAGEDERRWHMVERAQARMLSAGLTSRGFARRHAELTRELLGGLHPQPEERAAGITGWGNANEFAEGRVK